MADLTEFDRSPPAEEPVLSASPYAGATSTPVPPVAKAQRTGPTTVGAHSKAGFPHVHTWHDQLDRPVDMTDESSVDRRTELARERATAMAKASTVRH